MVKSLSGDEVNYDLRTRTYEDFRNQAIDLIPQYTPEWTDVFPHDPGVVLIELFAGMSDILSYYIDKGVSESHWATAQLRQSILNMADMLGYVPKPAVSSTVELTVTTTGAGGTVFGTNSANQAPFLVSSSATEDVGAFNFELFEEYTFAAAETEATLVFIEGRTVLNEIVGSSDGNRGQTFMFAQSPLTTNPDGSLPVTVQVFNGVSWVTWSQAPTDNFVESLPTDQHYTIDLDSTGKATIRFGDGINGAIPDIGSANIRATYRVGGGSTSNNVAANTIENIKSTTTLVTGVTNPAKPSGGDEQESLEEIKQNAPKVWATQNRAVTHGDYEAFARTINGVFKARATWYNNNPNQEAVYIAVTGDNPVPTGTWDINKQSGTGLLGAVGATLVDKKCTSVQVVMLPVTALGVLGTFDVHLLENYITSDVVSRVDQAIQDFIKDTESTEIPNLLPLSGLMATLEAVAGVDYIDVNTFRRVPYVEEVTVGLADTTFSSVTVGDVTSKEDWTIRFTTSTAFTVFGSVSGSQTPGSVGTAYTSDNGEISFTATAGTIANKFGDEYKITTGKEVGNIVIQEHEIPVYLGDNITINPIGGIPG